MARMWPWLFLFVSGGLIGLTAACRQSPVERAEAKLDEGPGVRIASLTCLQAAQDRDIDRLTSCFAADASMLAPDEPIARGTDEARGFWSVRVTNPGYNFSWRYLGAETESSGNMAYETGTYEMTLTDQKGKLVTTKGKFVLVWKKSRPGQWKIVTFMFSAD
jgi:ketosteroid isomerase-like protein